jgi:mannose-6-phosphate isomerase class I
VGSKGPFESLEDRSVEMVICTNGEATICDLKTGERLPMPKGRSIIVPAAVQKYRIEGSALLYKASVPLQRIGGQEAGKP